MAWPTPEITCSQKCQGADTPGTALERWRTRLGGLHHISFPSSWANLRCDLRHLFEDPQQDGTSVAYNPSLLMITPLIGAASLLSHSPLLPHSIFQVNHLNPSPCLRVCCWEDPHQILILRIPCCRLQGKKICYKLGVLAICIKTEDNALW